MSDKIKDQLIEMLIEHSRAMYSIISDMGVFYIAWAENSKFSKEILEKKANKLKFDIEAAATIKNQAIKDFSEVLPLGSGDWVILIQKMDNLSNLALKFVDLLIYIELSDLNSEMKKIYHKSINTILEMAELIPVGSGCEIMGDTGKALPKDLVKDYAEKNDFVFLEGYKIVEAWKQWLK